MSKRLNESYKQFIAVNEIRRGGDNASYKKYVHDEHVRIERARRNSKSKGHRVERMIVSWLLTITRDIIKSENITNTGVYTIGQLNFEYDSMIEFYNGKFKSKFRDVKSMREYIDRWENMRNKSSDFTDDELLGVVERYMKDKRYRTALNRFSVSAMKDKDFDQRFGFLGSSSQDSDGPSNLSRAQVLAMNRKFLVGAIEELYPRLPEDSYSINSYDKWKETGFEYNEEIFTIAAELGMRIKLDKKEKIEALDKLQDRKRYRTASLAY